jgi:hypothetical protein
MLKSLDHWFESRASLNDLQERYWNPILRSCASQLSAEIRSQVSKLIDNPFGGAELSLDSIRRLDRIEVSLSELHEKVMNQNLFDSGSDSFDLALDPSAIPVRRGLLDWILFRSRNAVRHRLFGSFHEPYREIRPEMKRRRLGIDGREALKKAMESHLESLFPAMPRRRAIQLLENYINGFYRGLREVLNAVGLGRGGEERGIRLRQKGTCEMHVSLVE